MSDNYRFLKMNVIHSDGFSRMVIMKRNDILQFKEIAKLLSYYRTHGFVIQEIFFFLTLNFFLLG